MTWLGRYEELAWALGLCAVAGWMFRWSVRRLRLALASRAWPEAPGVVRGNGPAYAGAGSVRGAPQFLGILVNYEYRVRSRWYSGTDVRFTAFYLPGHLRAMRKYPPGTRVAVRHHPNDPRIAVLEPGATVDGWVEAAAYGILLLVGAVWLIREVIRLAG